MSGRPANKAPKNATFASLGESLWTGPGGASKKPACAGPGGAACRALSSSIFRRRAFSVRSHVSSAARAEGISITPKRYATAAVSIWLAGHGTPSARRCPGRPVRPRRHDPHAEQGVLLTGQRLPPPRGQVHAGARLRPSIRSFATSAGMDADSAVVTVPRNAAVADRASRTEAQLRVCVPVSTKMSAPQPAEAAVPVSDIRVPRWH